MISSSASCSASSRSMRSGSTPGRSRSSAIFSRAAGGTRSPTTPPSARSSASTRGRRRRAAGRAARSMASPVSTRSSASASAPASTTSPTRAARRSPERAARFARHASAARGETRRASRKARWRASSPARASGGRGGLIARGSGRRRGMRQPARALTWHEPSPTIADIVWLRSLRFLGALSLAFAGGLAAAGPARADEPLDLSTWARAPRPPLGPPTEPWSDPDPPAPPRRLVLRDLGFRGGAEYRAQFIYVNPISLNTENARAVSWIEHRLRLDAGGDWRDKIRIVLSADVLDGVLWGDNGQY